MTPQYFFHLEVSLLRYKVRSCTKRFGVLKGIQQRLNAHCKPTIAEQAMPFLPLKSDLDDFFFPKRKKIIEIASFREKVTLLPIQKMFS